MKLKKGQKGLSLIEILISLVILAVGMVALIKFQGDLLRSRGNVNQQTEALNVVKNKIDGLRHYVVLNTTTGLVAYDDIVSGSSTVTGTSGTNYSLSWTVTDQTSPPHKVVRVTVSWTDQTNTSQSITLDSIIGKVDPLYSGKVMQGL